MAIWLVVISLSFVISEGRNALPERIREFMHEGILPHIQEGYMFENIVWGNKFKGYLVQVQKLFDF
jgi:hypothetical protein